MLLVVTALAAEFAGLEMDVKAELVETLRIGEELEVEVEGEGKGVELVVVVDTMTLLEVVDGETAGQVNCTALLELERSIAKDKGRLRIARVRRRGRMDLV